LPRTWLTGLLLCASLTGGCASLSNPTQQGIPVHRLPPELLAKPRADAQPIPLSLLSQEAPEEYKLGPGDVLGVYVAGILGEPNQPIPVRYTEQGNTPPTVGYPLPVREDGTIPLPRVAPLRVQGMTIPQAQEAILKAYISPKQLINPENAQIIVTLWRPRQYRILVMREDAGGPIISQTSGLIGTSSTIIGNAKRGYGVALDMPAYENDVLHALTRSGGLPGLDAINEVFVQRGALRAKDRPTVMPGTRTDAFGCPTGACDTESGSPGADALNIRIPLRLRPGEEIPFTVKDVVLNDGDVIFIRARDTELYYTGGLLGSGEYVLPRDYDLDVLEAVARVKAPLFNGGINQNNFNGTVTASGMGNPSPSQLSIVRRTACGGQVVIKVDLNRATQDPRERILVQAGDVLILQQTLLEAFSSYITTNFRLNFLGTIIRQNDLIGTASATLP
jgi:protein involved in polysaccharide export with SLBB domain